MVRRLLAVKLHVHRFIHHWIVEIPFFKGGDVRFVDEREADVIKSLQQALAAEWVNRKRKAQALVVGDGLLLQVHRQLVALAAFGALEQFVYLLVNKGDRQDAVLEAVIVEDVRIAWRDHRSKAVIKTG